MEIQLFKVADTHTYTHGRTLRTYVHLYIHTFTHSHMHTCTHAHMHTYIHTYIHTCMHTYIYLHSPYITLDLQYIYITFTLHYITLHYITYIHIHTYTDTYMYIYIYIRIHMQSTHAAMGFKSFPIQVVEVRTGKDDVQETMPT